MRTCVGLVLFRLALVLALAGCATIHRVTSKDTESMLSAAGFRAESADTPEKLAQLKGTPPYRLKAMQRDGQLVYVYADPDGCRCVYVGDEQAYAAYQGLAAAARAQLEHYSQHPLSSEWSE